MGAEGGDGGWVEESLKASLNWLCAVRGERDPDKAPRSKKERGSTEGRWIAVTDTHSQLWEVEALCTHMIPWVGKSGEWVEEGETGES